MNHFRVRPRTVREGVRGLPPLSVLMIPRGMVINEVYDEEWRDVWPATSTLASKARLCVEHDRRCDIAQRKHKKGAARLFYAVAENAPSGG